MKVPTVKREPVLRTLKAAGILTVCTVWLIIAIQAWDKGVAAPDSAWLNWVFRLLPEHYAGTSIKIYLTLSGFPLLVFYLSVLLPDILHRFFPKRKKLFFYYRISAGLVIAFGAFCAYVGCMAGSRTVFYRWLTGSMGLSLKKAIQSANLLMTPLILVLILLTWFLPAAIQFLVTVAKRRSPTRAFVGKTLGIYGLITVYAFLLVALSAILLAILDRFSHDAVTYVSNFCQRDADYASLMFVSVVLAPIIEEAAFRGGMQHHMGRVLPAWAALLITSVFFGLWHRNLGQFVYTFMDGIFWGLLYQTTGKLRHTVYLHFLNNLFAVMAYSTSVHSILGKLTFFPSTRKWLMKLPLFPAILMLLLCGLLIFTVIEGLFYLAKGRPSLLLKWLRKIHLPF